MLVLPVLFVIAILFLLIHTIKLNKNTPKNFPPGPLRLPFWGSYWFLLKEHFSLPYKSVLKLHEKYQTELLGFFMGETPVVTAYEHRICKEILTRDEFVGRSITAVSVNRGFGRLLGIFFTDGVFWKDQRWFSLRHMRDYGFGRRDELMEQAAADEIRHLISFFTSKPTAKDADVCTVEGVVKMPEVFFGPVINTLHHTISATHYDDYAELRRVGRASMNFFQAVDATGNSLCATPWLRHVAADYFGWNMAMDENRVILNFSKKIIEEHKRTFVKGHPRDFIDVYLEELEFLKGKAVKNTSFDEKQLLYVISDYMMPAPAGVGHQLNTLFANLLHNPEVQAKMQEEIDRVVGRSRLPSLDDRKNLPYNEAVLREGMRKDTLVPLGLARRAMQDTTLEGYFIPKDTILLPNLWGMHHDPKYWKEPNKFIPERFLDGEGALLAKDITLPFGAGKRLCAGETFARNTMFLYLTGVIQNFSFRTPQGHPMPDLSNQKNGVNLSIPDYYMEAVPRV